MKLRLAVFKEVHLRGADNGVAKPDKKAPGDLFKCSIRMNTGAGWREVVKLEAETPRRLRELVEREVENLAMPYDIMYEPPEGTGPRRFLKLTEDSMQCALRKSRGLHMVDANGKRIKKFDSSGYMVMAEPLALNPEEIERYERRD